MIFYCLPNYDILWYFMQIASLGDYISCMKCQSIFSEKNNKKSISHHEKHVYIILTLLNPTFI